MKDVQKIAMLAGLIVLVVVVAGLPMNIPGAFFGGLSHAFPYIMIGVVMYFVMSRRGCCGRSCRTSD
jgi:hypothetical protein